VLGPSFLVFLQFASIAWILYPKNSSEIFSFWWVLVLFSLIFSVWIFLHNRIGNFNITPQIKDGAKFVSSGPYRYIRHPMYFALIVGVFGVLTRLFSYSNLIAFLLMIIAVYLKARIEERLWIDHHKEYKEYLNSTKMIIPFVL